MFQVIPERGYRVVVVTALLLLGTGLTVHGQERGRQDRPAIQPQPSAQPQIAKVVRTRPAAELGIKHIAHYPAPATEGKSIAFEILVENTGTAPSSGEETLHFDCKNVQAGGPVCPFGAGERKLPALYPPPAPYATGPQTHSEQLLTQPTWEPGQYEVRAWIQVPGQTRRSEESVATIQVQGSVAQLAPEAAQAAIAGGAARVPAGRVGQDEKQVDEKAILACPTCFNPQPEPPGKEEQAAVQKLPDIPVPPGPQPLRPGAPGFNPDPPPPPQPGGLEAGVAKEAVVEMGYQALPILGIGLEAEWPGVDGYSEWKSFYNEQVPGFVSFRWKPKTTEHATSLGSARWFVHGSPNTSTPALAEGPAPVPPSGQFAGFTIDFKPVAGSKKPPLSYWVQVVGHEEIAVRRDQQPTEVTRSNTVKVDFVGSGEPTQFTDLPVYPSVKSGISTAVELSSLTAYGGDGGTDNDMEPYLLVAVVYLDGTTIKPVLNAVSNQIGFPNSTVRIAHGPQTHKNVAGNQSMSSGQTVMLPGSFRFETAIRPIGLDLVRQNNIPIDEKKLREFTTVGILAIGLEEDMVPSTETMNQLWAESVAALKTEFDNVIRGFTLGASELQNPQVAAQRLEEALRKALGPVADRLKDAAIAKTLDELANYLAIPGFPMVGTVLAAADAKDDYIGTGVKLISYEELMNSSTIPFQLNLPGNSQPDMYVIHGSARATQALAE